MKEGQKARAVISFLDTLNTIAYDNIAPLIGENENNKKLAALEAMMENQS